MEVWLVVGLIDLSRTVELSTDWSEDAVITMLSDGGGIEVHPVFL